MKVKGTWWLLMAVVLTSAYVAWDLNHETQTALKKDAAATFFKFQKDQVNEFSIEKGTERLRLKRSTDGWKIEEPLVDWADNSYVEEFISALIDERSIEVANEGDAVDLKIYGLEQPKAKLTVVNQAGQSTTVEISDKKNFEGNSLVKLSGDKQVLIGGATWHSRADKKAVDFRDKRLLRGKIGAVDEIELKNERGLLRLKLKDGQWQAVGAEKLILEQNRVRELLSVINETRALDFITDKVPMAYERKKYGLERPAVILKLSLGEKKWIAELGQGDDKSSYAFVSDPTFLLKLEPGQMKNFQKYDLDELREKKSAFAFDKLLVKKIELNNSLKKLNFELKGQNWELINKSANLNVDQEKIKLLIEALGETTVFKYASLQDQVKLKNPANRLQLKDETGQIVFELLWGADERRQFANSEKQVVLAKTNKHAEVFWLDKVSLNRFDFMNLVSAQEQKKEVKSE